MLSVLRFLHQNNKWYCLFLSLFTKTKAIFCYQAFTQFVWYILFSGLGGNEWFEFDDSGHTVTSDSVPVSTVQTIVGLHNNGAKIVQRFVHLLIVLAFEEFIDFCP